MIAPAAPQARERRERWTAILAALVTVSLWASAFVVIRYADRGLAPGALALGRLVVGSVLLGVLELLRRESRPPAQAVGAIALCGVPT